ncbi:hypothetical protein GW17_00014901 [Ensete ventricosum]|nr:hypothetical protein GW17_00014901 [Ensete ventricosum]
MDSLYAGPIIAVVPDTPPTAFCQGCCRMVGPSCWLCHAVSRLQAGASQAGRPLASTLPCRRPPAGRGATMLLAARFRCTADRLGLNAHWNSILWSLRADDGLDERLGMIWLVAAEERSSRVTGLIAAEICNSGPAGLMVAEIRNSGTTEPMVVKIHVSGTIELKVAKIHVSGAVGLTMAKTHVLGTTELMMAETHIPGTAGLTVVEIHVSNTTELMVAEIHISVGLIVAEVCSSGVAELRVVEIRNLGTIGLMVAEMRFCIARMYGSSASALRAPHARILREPTRADVANSRNESVLIDIVGSLGCVLSLPRVCEPLPGGL